MTREEEIKQLSSELFALWAKNGLSFGQIVEMAVIWSDAHQPSPWISVEDRLPECKWDERVCKNHSDYCVILQADGSRYVAQYYCDFETWSETSYMCEWLRDITHWMPIPELKGGKQ